MLEFNYKFRNKSPLLIEIGKLNDLHLSAEEKVILLCGASVARYSYAYWTATWADKNDAWYDISDVSKPGLGVVVSDVVGAIKGGVRGFGYGSALGGFGVAGAVVGSVGSGIGHSIEAGLLDYFVGLF